MNHSAISDYWGSLVARYRASPLPGFLRWWGRELHGLIPESLRHRLVPPRPELWLVAEPESREFTVYRGIETPERCDRFGADEDPRLLRDRWAALVEEFDEGNPRIRLCLPGREVLECPVELPLAVESNLDQALAYQLDQLTPFRADQVYYDYDIVERDSEHGRLRLELRLVPVTRIDALRERLAAMGIHPHIIDLTQREGEQLDCQHFNLLPEPERPRHVYARARLNWMLVGALVLVVAVVMVESLYLRARTAEQLRGEVAELRAEAETVMELQKQLEDSLAAANFLAERRRRQPVMIQVLDEVTRLLPDNMWLQQLRVSGDELQVQGLAEGSQQLIELINDSELFDEAEFRGSVSIDPTSGRERFNARARIETGRAADAADAESGE